MTLDPVVLLEAIRKLFEPLEGYKEVSLPNGTVMFVREFPEQDHLRIVVTTPVVASKKGPWTIAHYAPIKIAVQFNQKDCLPIKSTRACSKTWSKSVMKKITALADLIALTPVCATVTCRCKMYPKIGFDKQGNPRGTFFVEYQCSNPKCNSCALTAWRTGLKTDINSIIPKKYA